MSRTHKKTRISAVIANGNQKLRLGARCDRESARVRPGPVAAVPALALVNGLSVGSFIDYDASGNSIIVK